MGGGYRRTTPNIKATVGGVPRFFTAGFPSLARLTQYLTDKNCFRRLPYTSMTVFVLVYNTLPGRKMLSRSPPKPARYQKTTVAAFGGCRPDLPIDACVARRLDSTGRREIGTRNSSEGLCCTPSLTYGMLWRTVHLPINFVNLTQEEASVRPRRGTEGLRTRVTPELLQKSWPLKERETLMVP